jgi:hypothetical protein
MWLHDFPLIDQTSENPKYECSGTETEFFLIDRVSAE